MSCPAGQFPTGWGIERNEALAVAAAVPSSDGWVFRIENTGATAALVAAHIRCMARTQRASNGMTHRFAWRTRDWARLPPRGVEPRHRRVARPGRGHAPDRHLPARRAQRTLERARQR